MRICSCVWPLDVFKQVAKKHNSNVKLFKNDLILDCVDLRLPLREEEIAGVVEEWGVRVVQEQM